MPSEKAANTEAFVADASVAMAWAVESESSPEAKYLLDRIGVGVLFICSGFVAL